eukprot:1704275-Rhodomonas_salina.2
MYSSCPGHARVCIHTARDWATCGTDYMQHMRCAIVRHHVVIITRGAQGAVALTRLLPKTS